MFELLVLNSWILWSSASDQTAIQLLEVGLVRQLSEVTAFNEQPRWEASSKLSLFYSTNFAHSFLVEYVGEDYTYHQALFNLRMGHRQNVYEA